jgi:PST family polysaccharide transporter
MDEPAGRRPLAVEERAIRGVPWTFLSFGATKLITLATTVVLARLLDPADFGLMALAMLAFGFLGLFRDLGLGSTLVLRQDLGDRANGTILTLMIGTAVVVTVLVAASAPLAAALLDEGRLNSLLPALAATTVFGSLAWFYESLLQRDLDFRRRFVGQLTQSLGFTVGSIPPALAGAGVWSLVIGQIVSMLAYSGVYLLIVPHRVWPAYDASIARDAFLTGRGFLAQGWLAWVIQNIDYLIVGRVLGTAQLGYYSMAYRLSELTHYGIADPVAKVTFPGFARMRHEGREIAGAYRAALRLVALAVFLIGAILSGAAEPFTRAVFGPDWEPMIDVLAVLGVWAAAKPIQATVGWLLNSTGHAGALAVLSAVVVVAEIPLLIVAANQSTAAVAAVVLGETLVSLAAAAVLVQRRVGPTVRSQARALAPLVAAGAIGWLASRGCATLTDGLEPVLSLALSMAAGVAAYAASIRLLEPGTFAFAREHVSRAFGREAQVPA